MILGLTMRMKPSPSGCLMPTEEPLPRCQDRVDRGQEGTGNMTKVRIQSLLVSIFILYTIVVLSLILPLVRSIVEKP